MSILRHNTISRNAEIEEVNLSNIDHPPELLRSRYNDLNELAISIDRIGLLHPIVVRITEEGRFEIVAGNRRYDACKKLGWKKILSHIVELDDKSSFEVTLIENIQRRTLNPIEEALAFKKYVSDFGWGGVSDLAQKISKSPRYVCRRLKLLELPREVLDLISESEIHVSTAEELLCIKNKNRQSELAALILKRNVSSRKVRGLIRAEDEESIYYNDSMPYLVADKGKEISKVFDKPIIALRIALNKLAMTIESTENNWILYEILMQHKNMLHTQIDLLIREKKKYRTSKTLFSHRRFFGAEKFAD
jgi:ParB family transcriptional regulator, chromosome partitioning protein